MVPLLTNNCINPPSFLFNPTDRCFRTHVWHHVLAVDDTISHDMHNSTFCFQTYVLYLSNGVQMTLSGLYNSTNKIVYYTREADTLIFALYALNSFLNDILI